MRRLGILPFLLALLCLIGPLKAEARAEGLVFAASSLRLALEEAVRKHEEKTGHKILISFASSSILARQIDLGAPAGIFLSANVKWMEYLRKQGALKEGTVTNYLSNRLVLVRHRSVQTLEPKGEKPSPGVPADEAERKADFAAQMEHYLAQGHFALGDPKHVPVGIYTRHALEEAGLWAKTQERMVTAPSAMQALLLLKRGEAKAGILYRTDLEGAEDLRYVTDVPMKEEIHYPMALTAHAKEEVKSLYQFLLGREGKAIMKRHGFQLD